MQRLGHRPDVGGDARCAAGRDPQRAGGLDFVEPEQQRRAQGAAEDPEDARQVEALFLEREVPPGRRSRRTVPCNRGHPEGCLQDDAGEEGLEHPLAARRLACLFAGEGQHGAEHRRDRVRRRREHRLEVQHMRRRAEHERGLLRRRRQLQLGQLHRRRAAERSDMVGERADRRMVQACVHHAVAVEQQPRDDAALGFAQRAPSQGAGRRDDAGGERERLLGTGSRHPMAP